jgi:uncharacterized protein YecT (DUF1311 family)
MQYVRNDTMTIGHQVRNLGLASLLFWVGLAGPLKAQDAKTAVDCQNPTTQMAMNICAGRAAKQSDRKLNIAYKQLQQEYRSSDRKERLTKLTEAQLAWIKYRDTTCDWKSSKYSGGSIAPMIYSNCLDQLTQQRTQELLEDQKE